jgi:hypothetical protein
MYTDLSNGGNAEPVPNVMVVLCQVPAEGLPEGPAVAESNRNETEHICTLKGVPTALTDADGVFTLDGVPPATYLVVFHLFPDEMEEVEWDGVTLMEAHFNAIDQAVSPSGEAGFWEDGGPVIGRGNWSAAEGMTVSTGNVCSNKFGFCFSIRDGRPSPVIEIESNETVEIELTTHFNLIATPTSTMTPTPEPMQAEVVGIVAEASFKGNEIGRDIDKLAYGGKLMLLLRNGEEVEVDFPKHLLSNVKGCPLFNADEISAFIRANITIVIDEHQEVLLTRNSSGEWEILEVLP